MVPIAGGLAVGHDDDVVLLAALLHRRHVVPGGVRAGREPARIEPAGHAREVQADLSQRLGQRSPAVRGGRGHPTEQRRLVGPAGGHELSALFVVEDKHPEAHVVGVGDEIGQHLLGHADTALGQPHPGGVVIPVVAHPQAVLDVRFGAAGVRPRPEARLGIAGRLQAALDRGAGDVVDAGREQGPFIAVLIIVPAPVINGIGWIGTAVGLGRVVGVAGNVLGRHAAGRVEQDHHVRLKRGVRDRAVNLGVVRPRALGQQREYHDGDQDGSFHAGASFWPNAGPEPINTC